ncbi:MAG: hypothetical protein V1908_00015, partial [Candidatus Peregrinibacteria bacterium]
FPGFFDFCGTETQSLDKDFPVSRQLSGQFSIATTDLDAEASLEIGGFKNAFRNVFFRRRFPGQQARTEPSPKKYCNKKNAGVKPG